MKQVVQLFVSNVVCMLTPIEVVSSFVRKEAHRCSSLY